MLDVLVAARANLARSWRRSLAYGVLCALLAALVLTPFFQWLSLQALALGGAPVATNVDIATVLASLPGVLALLAWSLGTAVMVLLGLGGQVILAADAEHGAPRAPRSAFLASVAVAPRLLRPALGWVVVYALALVPVLLTAFDILRAAALGSTENVFLQVVPDSPLGALGVYGLLAAAVVFSYVILLRWTFLLHALLLEDRGLGAAMQRSAQLVAPNRMRVLRVVGALHLAVVLLLALEAWVFRALAWLAFDVIARDSPALGVILAALLLVGAGVAGLVTTALVGAAGSSLITALFVRLGGTVPLAAKPGEALRARLPKTGRGLLVLLGVLLVGALLLVWPQLERSLSMTSDPVQVTAHRGSSAGAPENTLAAFRLAMEEGADFSELDVLEAKDGAVVVIHDTNLKRLAGLDANVFDLTGAELQQIDVGRWKAPAFAGETIPLLRDVMELVKGRMKLNIEIKVHGRERDLPETLVDLIQEMDFAPHCVITSLDVGMLRRVRAKDPTLRIGAIVTAAIGNVHALDVDFYSVERALATVTFIRASHAKGREVHVWTTNTERTIRRMIDRGADSLITDHPTRAVALRDARGADDELRANLLRLFER